MELSLHDQVVRIIHCLIIVALSTAKAQTIEWIHSIPFSLCCSPTEFDVKQDIFLGPKNVPAALPPTAPSTLCTAMWVMGSRDKKDCSPSSEVYLPAGNCWLKDHGNYYTGGTVGSKMFCGTGSFSIAVNPTTPYYQSGFVSCHDSTGNLKWVSVCPELPDYKFSTTTKLSATSSGDILALIAVSVNGGPFAGFRIAKYKRSNGQPLWITPLYSLGLTYAYFLDCNMVCDPVGNCYVSGQFMGDSLSLGATTLYSAPDLNALVAKFNSDGNVIWVKSVGQNDTHISSLDVRGSALVLGCEVVSSKTSPTLTCEVFMYDTSGSLQWTSPLFSRDRVPGNLLVSIHPRGDVYTVASFRNMVTYTINAASYTINSAADQEEVLARFSASGQLQWLSSSTASQYQTVDFNHLQCDDDGAIYLSGGNYNAGGAIPSFMGELLTGNFVMKLNDPLTGIREMNDVALKLFPNPAGDLVAIRGLENTAGMVEVSILSPSTVVLRKFVFQSAQSRDIPVGDLPQGVYGIMAKTGNGTWTGKFVKE